MWLIKTVISLLLVYLAIKFMNWYKQRQRLIMLMEKLPGPPNFTYLPVINHSIAILYLDFVRHKEGTFTLIYHVLRSLHKLFPEEGLFRFWLGLTPVVALYSPENVESLLNSTTVIDKSKEYGFFEPWLGEGLVTSKRSKWRIRRKILTPAFHFRILNDFLPIINEEATKLVRKLNQAKYLDHKVTDLAPLIALCTLDTICETAMGVNIDCQNDEHSPYVQALYEIGELTLTRVTRPWLWSDFLFYRSELGKRFIKAKNIMHSFTTKVILERKAAWQRQMSLDNNNKKNNQSSSSSSSAVELTSSDSNKESEMTFDDMRSSVFFSSGDKRLAFLDILLHQHLSKNTMSIDDVREEVDTFMFAGHDTTAMNISWTLYMLGLHPDIQDKVRKEVDRVLGMDDEDGSMIMENSSDILNNKLRTQNITNEQLREMKYLDRVIKESLRMWPSIPFVARSITEDILVGNKYLIPKGSSCIILTHTLHNNAKYFPRPEIFDPDRFLPENSVGRHPFAYIPFSAGPRNCIGQKFARMEVKVIIAKLIRNYYIKACDHRDKLALVGEMVLRSRNGLNVEFMPRFTKTSPPTE